MAAGSIASSVLSGIANAIREKGGTSARLAPTAMAAAVAALDGTDAGEAAELEVDAPDTGLVDDSVFGSIAAAIRAQNGEATLYRPGDMAAAILALSWETEVYELAPRAVLCSDGTLEFNCRTELSADATEAGIESWWEVDETGYASLSARPWDGSAGLVTCAAFASDWEGAGVTDYSYWLGGCDAMTEVSGFERVGGLTSCYQMFEGCGALETIWCDGEPNTSACEEATMAFYGCYRLVGGALHACESHGSAGSSAPLSEMCLGADGVLTDPGDDQREWAWGHLYEDGGLVVAADSAADGSRELLSSGRFCVNTCYDTSLWTPWRDGDDQVASVSIAGDMGGFALVNCDYWFSGLTALESVEGLCNLGGLADARCMFMDCSALEELDLRGLDNSTLGSVTYLFSYCTALTTILADADWELPDTCSGSFAFYNCNALVGGNGTTYSSSRVSYRYMVIDSDSATGYLTAG